MNNIPVEYRIHFFSPSGNLLATTEFNGDRDALIYVVDTVNQMCREKLRAHPETKGRGYVDASNLKHIA